MTQYESMEPNATWRWGLMNVDYPGYEEDQVRSQAYKPSASVNWGVIIPGFQWQASVQMTMTYIVGFDGNSYSCHTDGDGSFALLFREGISYAWTAYKAQDPLPAHAVVIGKTLENQDMFMIRVPNTNPIWPTDHFWSYYIRGAELARAYPFAVKSYTEMEILEIYD